MCYVVIFDWIEVGMFLCVVVVVGGDVMLMGVCLYIFDVVIDKLCEVGVLIEEGDSWLCVKMDCCLLVVMICMLEYLVFLIDM